MSDGLIPRRPFGKSGETVSLLGVGGYHLGVPADEKDAFRIVHTCMDAGADFMDCAWEYNDGESERRLGKALAMDGRRDKAFLMTKDCAHDRRAHNSRLKLEQSLTRLKTDRLDLWMIHEVVWEDDPDRILAPGGSAEALVKAKEQGKTRFIGFTGHKSPKIFKRMLDQGFPWDTVLMPVNVLDAHYDSFINEIIPICKAQGIAMIGMKSFADGWLFKSGCDITPQEALRYAMSQDISCLLSGMESMERVEQGLAAARGFQPMSAAETAAILARSQPYALTGEWEPFKTSRNYEGPEGRNFHNVKYAFQ